MIFHAKRFDIFLKKYAKLISLNVKQTKEGKKVKSQAQTVFLRDQLLEVTVKT